MKPLAIVLFPCLVLALAGCAAPAPRGHGAPAAAEAGKSGGMGGMGGMM